MKILETKTVRSKQIDGSRHQTVFALQKCGEKAPWYAILYLSKDGESLQNQWGGYRTKHVGSAKYIKSKWKHL